jgi:60 kDa SS-A/Ro ribonucleoprotein
MTATILRHTNPKAAAPKRVVANNSGGPAYEVDAWSRLHRFLVLGTEGGTYYVSERDHVLDNVKSLDALLQGNGMDVVDAIVNISQSGRAPKNDYAIYALAYTAAHGTTLAVRQYALSHINSVCRTGTHFLQFVDAITRMRGTGPAVRKALAAWFLRKSPDDAAFQMLKYQNRAGWTMRDVLRIAHPKTSNRAMNALFEHITKPDAESIGVAAPAIVWDAQFAKTANVDSLVGLIITHRFPRELIPTQHLNNPRVASALAQTAPYTALMRNLGNYSKANVFDSPTVLSDTVTKLSDPEYIKKSRVHPISVLTAHRTYTQGTGYRGNSWWVPNPKIVAALDQAFYASFVNVEPIGQPIMVGVDVSASMNQPVMNGILTSAEVAAALSMVWKRTEPWVTVFGFNHGLKDLDIRKGDDLQTVCSKTRGHNMGGTDVSLPIQHALDNRIPVGLFVIITDNETNRGRRNPSELLREYRRVMGIDAKLVVLATDATRFTVADPLDKGMLDIAGFDSAVPAIVSMFARGELS